MRSKASSVVVGSEAGADDRAAREGVLRILFCNFEYPPLGGGGGVVNAYLAEELAKRHRVSVLTSRLAGQSPRTHVRGVELHRVRALFRRSRAAASLISMASFLVLGYLRGRQLVASRSFDVVNTHFVLPSGPVGERLARSGGLPHVLSVHGGDLYDPSKRLSPHRHWVLRAWIRRMLRRADAIVGQSRNTLDNMRRFYTPEIEGVRIPLGIPRPSAQPPVPREALGAAEDEVLFVTVGRLVRRKAVEQLLDLMAQLADAPSKLLIAGDGPERGRLESEAAQKGLQGRVRFLGHVEESRKHAILQASDVFVSSSQHEGFGLVFLEAMAAGLPVVCYDHGGQTDVLENGETGYLVPLNDLSELVRCCRALIENPGLRQAMSRRARAAVEGFFIEHCARLYEDLFAELAARARCSRSRTAERG